MDNKNTPPDRAGIQFDTTKVIKLEDLQPQTPQSRLKPSKRLIIAMGLSFSLGALSLFCFKEMNPFGLPETQHAKTDLSPKTNVLISSSAAPQAQHLTRTPSSVPENNFQGSQLDLPVAEKEESGQHIFEDLLHYPAPELESVENGTDQFEHDPNLNQEQMAYEVHP